MIQGTAVMQMLTGAAASVYDKVATQNKTGMANESANLAEDVGNHMELQNATVTRDEAGNMSMTEDFAATGGSGMSFYARVCAGINCHSGVPLSDVHNFGEALVGRHGGTCVAAFRGTANVADAMQDVSSHSLESLPGCPGCRVGSGFLHGYEAVVGQVKGALRGLGCHRVAVTGHSLGAAKAILALYELAKEGYEITTSYVFGEPRVGNSAFRAAFYRTVHAQVFRVVHGQDPIVKLGAPGSSNVGTEIYESGNSVLTDHLHYAGVHLTPCMPDGLPGGAAAEEAGEEAAHAAESAGHAAEHAAEGVPGGAEAVHGAEHAAECCLRLDWSCCIPR